MEIVDVFGWLGAIGYSLCSIPQIIVTIKTGKVALSGLFIVLYLTASVLSFIYAVHAYQLTPAISFFIAIGSWSILLKYKLWTK